MHHAKTLITIAALMSPLWHVSKLQPLGKGLLQRLLLNLCVHSVTRVTLLQLLLEMLRPDVEARLNEHSIEPNTPTLRLYGCQWNVVYARSQLSNGNPWLATFQLMFFPILFDDRNLLFLNGDGLELYVFWQEFHLWYPVVCWRY
jgi:hypothetical protein